MSKNYKILAINLGSTSTKIAAWDNEAPIFAESLNHPREDFAAFTDMWDQYDYRLNAISAVLQKYGLEFSQFDILVSRGGNVRPVPGGIYEINEAMLADMKEGKYGRHPNCIGNAVVYEMGKKYGKPAIFVDPPVTDEFIPEARLTGMPEITRLSSFHALNQKATARKIAAEIGKSYTEVNLIICHLGGGISVGAHKDGKVIDVNNALDGDGPMAPERAGAVPTKALVDMCFSGEFTQEDIHKKITGKGGWVAHLGSPDGREIVSRMLAGDEKASAVFNATFYQVCKNIGAMAAVLDGKVDGIGLTGSLAYAPEIVDYIKAKTSFIAPFFLYPGENEMEALCAGALRFLNGVEAPQSY